MDEIKDYLEKYTDALVELCEASIGGDEKELGRKTEALEESIKELNKTLNLSLKAAQPQWQPIETAPKDGTAVLGISKKNKIFITCYLRHEWQDLSFVPRILNPTHWMSLPPSPQQ